MMRTLFIATAATLAACSPTEQPVAEATPEATAPPVLAGEYIFGGTNLTAEPCGMTLQGNAVEGARGFHNVDLDPECVGHYSFLMALSGWEELDGGGIRLIGAEGSTMGDFRRSDRVFEGVIENDGNSYLLTPMEVWSNPQ